MNLLLFVFLSADCPVLSPCLSSPADHKDVSVMMSEMDVNAIAGTLKLYFRELPEPLFTDELYPNFAGGISEWRSIRGQIRSAVRMCKTPLLLCSPVRQRGQGELHAEPAAVAAWTQPGHVPLPLGPPEEVGAHFTSWCTSWRSSGPSGMEPLCAVLTLISTGGTCSEAAAL